MKSVLCWLAAIVGAVFLPGMSAAATWPLNPGGNLTQTVESAADGDTITLSPGTYTPMATGAFPAGSQGFAVTKRVRIVGLGSTPSAVVLSAPVSTSYAFRFFSYTYAWNYSTTPPTAMVGNPSGATLENVTISSAVGGGGGVNISEVSLRLTDISLKNVVINTPNSVGILLDKVDRTALDGVQVSSSATGFYIRDSTDTLMMNSTVTGVTASGNNALAVVGGASNVITNNILGTAAGTPNGVTVNGGAVVFYNTQSNRFELNTVQGHRDDGVDFHNTSLASGSTLQTLDNYVGKNAVVSNGWSAGRTAGTGVWVNCSANNTWLYGNDVQGGPEAGLTVWTSKSNMLLGNSAHNNKDAGLFISGASDTFAFCPVAAYQVKPARNVLQSNSIFFNRTDSIVVRTSDNTDLVMNHLSPKNGFAGASQSCTAPECQSAVSLEANVTGTRFLRNTADSANRGLWVNDGTIAGLEFFGNRMIGSTLNRLIQPSSLSNLDWGISLGGNFWSQHAVSGNPGSTPFTGISYDSLNTINGPVSDRYPFQSETFGASELTVSEPLSGQYAQGSARTVRWNAPGCTYVDITLDGGAALHALDGITTLPTNLPNTGYAVIRIPAGTSLGAHNTVVSCKSRSGTATGLQSNGPTFTVVNADLTLLSPGRDDVFNAGQSIWISWKRVGALLTGAVTIELSTDGGLSYSPVAATYPALVSASTANFARVTLPSIPSTAYAMIRIRSGAAADSTDGVFAIRGASGAGFKNIPAGRTFTMGRLERLEWASPQDSRLVSISYSAGSASGSVVTDLPDRGYLDWIVPDIPTNNLQLTVTYKTNAGSVISSSALATGTASTAYPVLAGMFALSVSKTGGGTVTASGISCGSTCSQSYASGTAVTLTAVADFAWTFSGWSGACSGAVSTCTLTMDAAKSAVATFTANYTGILVTRYRLYSSGTKEHLYTTDANEYSVLSAGGGWLGEGSIYRLFQAAGSLSGVNAIPYYRLYNPTSFQHHWTTDANEYAVLATKGWKQEGLDGYILPSQVSGTLPVYRLYYAGFGGLHLWTTDVNEKAGLTTTAGGWADEGIVGYVLPLQ